MAKQNKVQIKITAKNKTKAAFASVTSGLKGIAAAAFSMKTAIGAAAGIAGLGYLMKRSMDLTDELAKSSEAIGVSVEALQRLRHAANLGGIESKALDKAIQKLAINIAEVATGTGEAKDAFEKYKISATNADGSLRSVASIMDQVAGIMQGVTNRTEQASLAYDLFGARGAKMVNILKDGKQGLHAAMLEADQLGLVMSQTTVKGVEEANDAITRLTSFIAGVFNRVVAEMAPLIQGVTDSLRDWVQMKVDGAGGAGKLARDLAISIVQTSKTMVSAFATMTNNLIGFNNALGGLSNTWERIFGNGRSVEDIEKSITNTVEQLKELNNISAGNPALAASQAASRKELEESLKIMRDLLKTGNVLQQQTPLEAVDVSNTLASLDALIAGLEAAQTASENLSISNPIDDGLWAESLQTLNVELARLDGIDKLKAAYRIFQTQLALYEADVKADNDAWDAKLRSMYMAYGKMRAYGEKQHSAEIAAEKKAWDEKLEVAYQAYGKFRLLGEKHAIDTRNAFEKAADGIADAYESMQSSVEDTLTDLLVAGGSWKDAMMDIANIVYREFVRVQIAAPLAQAGNSVLAGIFDNMFDGGPPVGGAGRAIGGPVVAGRSYVVGERGPELFTPGQSGGITPNNQLGGQPVQVTYNIQSWDSRDTMATLQKSAPQIVGIIQEAFNKRGQRGFA